MLFWFLKTYAIIHFKKKKMRSVQYMSKYDLIKKMEERNSFIYKVKRVLDSMILQDE